MGTLGNDLMAMYYMQNISGIHILKELGYVTDGLQYCWDAEYNLCDKHSDSTTAWHDMVSNTVLPYSGSATYKWNPKSLEWTLPVQAGSFKVESEYVFSPGTLEGVARVLTISGQVAGYPSILEFRTPIAGISLYKDSTRLVVYNQAHRLPQVIGDALYQKNGRPVSVMALTNTATYWADTDLTSNVVLSNCKVITPSWQGYKSFKLTNGILIGTGGVTNPAITYTSRFYCFRAYNRVLTTAELQQNWAVDQSRFSDV